MNEIWKTIKDNPNYEVSNFGRIRVIEYVKYQKHYSGCLSRYVHQARIIKARPGNTGYMTVGLWKDGKCKTYRVHRLVAERFVDNPNNKPFINHLDANKHNNFASNLEWCTQSENIQYAYDHGTKIPPHQRTVGQFTLDGNLITTWESIAKAHRETGINNIFQVCAGKRFKAGGFIWRYM